MVQRTIFSFKEIKQYTTVIKLTELQRHKYPIQMLHFKSSSCLSSGKKWFEKSRYDKHTDSTILPKPSTCYIKWLIRVGVLFYTILHYLFVFTLFNGYGVPTISKRKHALQEVLKIFRFTLFQTSNTSLPVQTSNRKWKQKGN